LSSTSQEIVNWVTTADGCVHTADTTQLDFVVGKFVQTRRDCRQLVANSVHTTDATQLDNWVASAVCIGRYFSFCRPWASVHSNSNRSLLPFRHICVRVVILVAYSASPILY